MANENVASLKILCGDERVSDLINRKAQCKDPFLVSIIDKWEEFARAEIGFERRIIAMQKGIEDARFSIERARGSRDALEGMMVSALDALAEKERVSDVES